MNAVRVLLKKDLKIFFNRPLFYFIAALCTIFWSPVFVYAFGEFLTQVVSMMGAGGEYMSFHQRVVVDFVAIVNFMLLLFVNGITMKLITEEKKNRTYDLLMTSPIRSWHIVAAKFLAGYTVVAMLILISMLYPASISVFGKIEWAPLLSSYLGLFLFGAVYVAIGLFASAMTQSTIVAFLLSLIFNLALWFSGIGSEAVADAWLSRLFDYINFEPIFKSFSGGVIRGSSILYLVSVTVLALVGAERVIETSRWR